MIWYQGFFAGAIGLFFGVLALSLFPISFFTAVLGIGIPVGIFGVFLRKRSFILIVLTLFFLGFFVGAYRYRQEEAAYYSMLSLARKCPKSETPKEGEAIGMRRLSGSQYLVLVRITEGCFSGVKTRVVFPHSETEYGDRIGFSGPLTFYQGTKFQGGWKKEGVVMEIRSQEVMVLKQGEGVWRQIIEYRKAFLARIFSVMDARSAALAAGLIFGEDGYFSQTDLEKMNTTGLRHIIALSGANLAAAGVVVFFLFRILLGRGTAFFLTSGIMFGYAMLAGFSGSVARAYFMYLIFLFSEVMERKNASPRNALAAAGALLLFFQPFVLSYDVGFLLSFAAVFGLLYLYPALQKIVILEESVRHVFWYQALALLSVMLMTTPILLYYFHSFSFISVAANLLLVPLTPYLMIIAILIGAFGLVSLSITQGLWLLLELPFRFFFLLADFFSAHSFSLDIPLPFPIFVLYYLLLAIFFIKKDWVLGTRPIE